MTDPIAAADPASQAAATCGRIEAVDADLHAFLPEQGRRARLTAQARELSARWPAVSGRPPQYAAYCGVAGYRPTHGRIPADGVIPFAPSLDVVGC